MQVLIGQFLADVEEELIVAKVGEEILAYEWMDIAKGEQAANELSPDETEGVGWDAREEGEFIRQGEISWLYAIFFATGII